MISMKVKLNKGRAPSQDAIGALARTVGELLDSEFLEFVAENVGEKGWVLYGQEGIVPP